MPIRQINEALQAKAKEELNEDPKRIDSDIEYLKEWLKKQPHIKSRNDDQQLVSYLRGCKFSLERTKTKLDMYYTMKTLLPEFFSNRNPFLPEIQSLLNLGVFLPVENPDPTAPRVTIIRNGVFNPSDTEYMYKANLMMMDISVMEEEEAVINGVIVIQDMANITLNHVANPGVMKKALKCIQEAYPSRVKGLHFINVPQFFETGFSIAKPFLSEKIKSRVTVHGSNLDTLYSHVPREILPKEYGGQGPTIDEIIRNTKKKVESYQDWFLEDEQYRSDESKRIGTPKTSNDMFGFEGSFRKLQVD